MYDGHVECSTTKHLTPPFDCCTNANAGKVSIWLLYSAKLPAITFTDGSTSNNLLQPRSGYVVVTTLVHSDKVLRLDKHHQRQQTLATIRIRNTLRHLTSQLLRKRGRREFRLLRTSKPPLQYTSPALPSVWICVRPVAIRKPYRGPDPPHH